MSYFASDYFNGSHPQCVANAAEPDHVLTDGECMRWVVGRLRESGLFELVARGVYRLADRGTLALPAAIVWPVGWTEDDRWDPDQLVRTLKYAVSITVRADDEDDAQDALDELSNAVANLLGGQSPESALAGLSRIEQGVYDSPASGGKAGIDGQGGRLAVIKLLGSVAYFVPGQEGRE